MKSVVHKSTVKQKKSGGGFFVVFCLDPFTQQTWHLYRIPVAREKSLDLLAVHKSIGRVYVLGAKTCSVSF